MVAVFIKIVVFLLSLGAVIVGHKTVGWDGFLIQCLGLVGLLTLLFLYNRKFK